MSIQNRWFAFLVCGYFFSCQPIAIHEKHQGFTDHCWKRAMPITGELDISDSTALYDVYLLLRHTDQYAFNNIYIDLRLQNGKDTIAFTQQSLTLGHDATGWEGSGMDDIWEVRKRINREPISFNHVGPCRYVLKNIMSQDPLGEVLSAGIRIEKCRQQTP
ncbi:MAG: gliding motility lipoprotein GldH [Ferruginibacter sp.]